MVITRESIIMSLYSSSFIIGSGILLLLISKWRYKKMAIVIYILGIIRLVLPINFLKATLIRDKYISRFIMDIFMYEIFPNISILKTLLFFSILGAVYFILRLKSHYKTLHSICLQSTQISSEHFVYKQCQQILNKLGYTGKFQIAVANGTSTPIQAGYFYPYIILSYKTLEFPPEQLWFILYHEIIHYHNRDLWIKKGILILKCIFWWNPLISYFVYNSIDNMLELRCDNIVCSKLSKKQKENYQNTLLHTLETHTDPPMEYIGFTNKGLIKVRLKSIIATKKRYSKKFNILIFSLYLFIFALSYIIIIQAGTPDTLREAQKKEGIYVKENDENTFILYYDGKYFYIEDGVHRDFLSEQEILEPPYNSLTIIEATSSLYSF